MWSSQEEEQAVEEEKARDTAATERKKSIGHKIMAVLEVIIVRHVIYTLIAMGLLLFMYGTLDPEPFPLEASYIVGSLWFVIPALMIFGLRRKPSNYGITTEKAPESIDLAFSAFPYFLLTFAGYVTLMIGGWSYLEPLGALLMTGIFLLSTFLVARLISTKYNAFDEMKLPKEKHRNNVVVLIILLMFPILLAVALDSLSVAVLHTVIWQFIFSGFGEEIFFRGYIQSRLNQVFGRPYEWKSIQFGLGLFITAALFAISHMFSIAGFLIGDFTVDWWYGTFTFVGGILFGLLREKTGSIVASGTLHGLEAAGEGIAAVFG
ncbi:MAG: CPBP family intramembrane metalloprotease [Candidatus Lokiarchaeota archaeon]|nr:CPBP family intramembrane metalloprotease [Candidatus Lokiarchaeota archaeon]